MNLQIVSISIPFSVIFLTLVCLLFSVLISTNPVLFLCILFSVGFLTLIYLSHSLYLQFVFCAYKPLSHLGIVIQRGNLFLSVQICVQKFSVFCALVFLWQGICFYIFNL
jgi:hypothetical protein